MSIDAQQSHGEKVRRTLICAAASAALAGDSSRLGDLELQRPPLSVEQDRLILLVRKQERLLRPGGLSYPCSTTPLCRTRTCPSPRALIELALKPILWYPY